MAKKIVGFIKLQVPAGKANPSPPIGPALAQHGLNNIVIILVHQTIMVSWNLAHQKSRNHH